MNQVTDQQIIEILRKEAVPALGCTEPVACALACAKCKEVLGVCPSVWTYWLVVIFTRMVWVSAFREQEWSGCLLLPLWALFVENRSTGLEVLKEVNVGDNLQRAKDMLRSGDGFL